MPTLLRVGFEDKDISQGLLCEDIGDIQAWPCGLCIHVWSNKVIHWCYFYGNWMSSVSGTFCDCVLIKQSHLGSQFGLRST